VQVTVVKTSANLVQTTMIHQSQLNRTEVVHPRMGTEEYWKAVVVGARVPLVWMTCWNCRVGFNALLTRSVATGAAE
jgi:hypothetical protein